MSSTTISKLYGGLSWRNLEYHQTNKNNKKKARQNKKQKEGEKKI